MPVWLGSGVLAAVLLYAVLRWFATARAADVALALRTLAAVFSALASTGLVFSGRLGLAVVTVAATAVAVRSLVLAGRAAGAGSGLASLIDWPGLRARPLFRDGSRRPRGARGVDGRCGHRKERRARGASPGRERLTRVSLVGSLIGTSLMDRPVRQAGRGP